MSVPNTFATATGTIPLSKLDANFAYYDNAYNITGTSVTYLGNVTLNTGTANGVAYLNGSKVLTTGSALQFDGSNLGLGVTPNAWNSSFKALQMAGRVSLAAGSANPFYIGSNWFQDSGGTNKYIASDTAQIFGSDGAGFVWRLAPSGTAGNPITFIQAMTLDASGNLLLNTTSLSTYKANFNGAVGVYGGNGVFFQNGSNNAAAAIYNDGATGVSQLQFNAGGSERARIDSSGNLLVGTTTASPTNSNSFYCSTSNGALGVNHLSGSSSGNTYIAFNYNGSVIGSVTQNGTTGVLYNLTSDYRLKNNPTPVTGAKEFVMALQPKTWDWWDGSGKGVGFIAHEFMEVAKYSGMGEKDAVDENGKPVYQSIQPSSSEVMANLVALIQEQQNLIQQLQADVAALKG